MREGVASDSKFWDAGKEQPQKGAVGAEKARADAEANHGEGEGETRGLKNSVVYWE